MDRNEAISREEAVRTISRISGGSVSYAEDLYDSFFPKPVVPQFVADWYEEYKEDFELNLFQCVYEASEDYTVDSANKFWHWLMSKDIDALTTLVNMHQFGYEVEKETRYTVQLKGLTSKRNYLNHLVKDGMWYFNDSVSTTGARTHHTKKELEANGFGWVFDCPGVEVKEVE